MTCKPDRVGSESSQAQLDAAQHEVDVANLGVKLGRRKFCRHATDSRRAWPQHEVVSAQDALARANDNQIAASTGTPSEADLSHAIGQIEGLYSK